MREIDRAAPVAWVALVRAPREEFMKNFKALREDLQKVIHVNADLDKVGNASKFIKKK